MSQTQRKRYVLVGTGGRSVMFIDPLVSRYREHATLNAICDLSQTRMDWHNLRIRERFNAPPIDTYRAADFDRMIREKRPDAVIVCTMDSTHHEYIVRAMEHGCDVICEKPVTIDAPKLRAVFDAIRCTGRSLRVTHNVRYSPPVAHIRQLIRDGVIGKPKAATLMWQLDTKHGADYFHRWHREKDKSGGLLIHKASHHFDMINWWIDSFPKTVYAMGDLMFYGRHNAAERRQHYAYDRYTGHPEAADDPFAIMLDERDADETLSVPGLRGLYLNAEKETGYLRDRNVFGDDITAEDVMSITARYRNGVLLNYSLIAFCGWEGFRANIVGDKGSIEVFSSMGSHVIKGQSDAQMARQMQDGSKRSITVHPMFGAPYEVDAPKGEGAHGGGDELLIRDLFCPEAAADPLNRAASHIDGAAAVLLGIAANESIRTDMPIDCDELLRLPYP